MASSVFVLIVLFMDCFFLFCFCGAFFVFAVPVFVIVGFRWCKVGIDKSVFVSFTDGVCAWMGRQSFLA